MSMNDLVNGMMQPGTMQQYMTGNVAEPTPAVEAMTRDIDNVFSHSFGSAEPVKSTEQIESDVKPYIIRPLNANDIFPMTRIIRKIGLKDCAKCFEADEINAMVSAFSSADNMDDIAKAVGVTVVFKVVDVLLEHIPDVGQELFAFIAGLIGKTADDVAALPLDVFFDLVVDVFQRKEFMGFMKVVSRFVR